MHVTIVIPHENTIIFAFALLFCIVIRIHIGNMMLLFFYINLISQMELKLYLFKGPFIVHIPEI